MKKLTGILLSFILILSLGTTVLAEPGVDEFTAPVDNEDIYAQPGDEENQDSNGDESDSLSNDGDIEQFPSVDGDENELLPSEEENEGEPQDTITEELEETEEELESEDEEEEEEEEEEEDDEEDLESQLIELLSSEIEVKEYTSETELSLRYDDRCDLSELSFSDDEGGIATLSSDVKYVVVSEYGDESDEDITSYKVSQGARTDEKDESLITLKENDVTTAIASGVGSGTVWLVCEDQEDKLKTYLNDEEDGEEKPLNIESQLEDSEDIAADGSSEGDEDLNVDEGDLNPESEDMISDNETADLDVETFQDISSSDESDKETINVYGIKVTVEQAPLTLMFLAGQSNMEGYCDDYTGYNPGASIVCEEGEVYSTYAPWSSSFGSRITGLSFSNYCTLDNYNSTAGFFVAGSLQEGTNMTGEELEYPINSLTAEGGGKTGPDSALAYEWNKLTDDKVWVVNTAYGATSITRWTSGKDVFERARAVWDNVLSTYNAEIGNHYSTGKKLVFWLQGEADMNRSAEEYEDYFAETYSAMESALNPDAIGIIMVRASRGDYTTDDELEMTGPRIAQYWFGSANSAYEDVYVVSNANEQWVDDSGVKSYFQNAYPNGSLSYPMHGYSTALPTTVSAVHSDIHYSQIGHNENGITAADGMYYALNNAAPTGVSWRDEGGQGMSSVSFNLGGDTTKMVEVAEPVYAAKSVSYNYGNCASYNGATAILTGNETGNITATYGGSTISQLSVNVKQATDISGKIGKVTGVYEYNGSWWYVENGIIQRGYEGVEQNSYGWWYIYDGKVNFSYTGFAHNSYGWWYIEGGKVIFSTNSVIQDTNKKIDGTNGWWYVEGGKVQTSYTGVANYSNSNGWWYVENGKVNFSANTVAQNKNGWWYVEGGKVIFSYNGFGKNNYGWWYIKDGKVIFSTNSVIQDKNKKIDGKDGWWYVVGGQVQTSYTGVANYSNSNGWWYVKNGKVDFSANTVAQNNYGWWYVVGGKVQFSFTGVGNYSNAYGWWYIKGGKVDFSASTVAQNNYGWWYVKDGKVQFGFNGIAQNSYGWWYIKNGKVDFSFNGTVKVSGKTYSVSNGKVAR